MPRPMMTVAGERNRDGRCPLSASKTSPRGSLVRRDGVHRTACELQKRVVLVVDRSTQG
jgi:hypothetical protein